MTHPTDTPPLSEILDGLGRAYDLVKPEPGMGGPHDKHLGGVSAGRAAASIEAAMAFLATLDASTPVSVPFCGTENDHRARRAQEPSTPVSGTEGLRAAAQAERDRIVALVEAMDLDSLNPAANRAEVVAAIREGMDDVPALASVDAPRPEPRTCIFDGCAATWRHFHGGFPGGYTNPDDPDGAPIPFTDPNPKPDVRDYNGREVRPEHTDDPATHDPRCITVSRWYSDDCPDCTGYPEVKP